MGWNEAYTPNKRFGSFVDDVELFDHAFFNTAQPEAEAMDAQQRLLLEAAFEALQCTPHQTFSGPVWPLAGLDSVHVPYPSHARELSGHLKSYGASYVLQLVETAARDRCGALCRGYSKGCCSHSRRLIHRVLSQLRASADDGLHRNIRHIVRDMRPPVLHTCAQGEPEGHTVSG